MEGTADNETQRPLRPVLLIPHKCAEVPSKCQLPENIRTMRLNITTRDTEGVKATIYNGKCDVKVMDYRRKMLAYLVPRPGATVTVEQDDGAVAGPSGMSAPPVTPVNIPVTTSQRQPRTVKHSSMQQTNVTQNTAKEKSPEKPAVNNRPRRSKAKYYRKT